MNIATARLCVFSMALSFALAARAQLTDTKGLSEASLEDLMQVEVTTASKKPQKLANVAASVFVITAEDIRRAGVNSIPEALQLAPGVDATRLTASRWAISARGFAERLSNKMLVVIDGRNAYSPGFSGVFWEDIRLPLEDVARIEVIRGPATAVWGTNGVNGVVNIITKAASATQGVQVVAGGGNVEGGYARARYGATLNSDTFFRIYASGQESRSQRSLNALAPESDHFRSVSAGFRLDGYLAGGARWDVTGDITNFEEFGSLDFRLSGEAMPNGEVHRKQTLRARYVQSNALGEFQTQASFANVTDTLRPLGDRRKTFDLDLQQRTKIADQHDVIVGANYRYTTDKVAISRIFEVTPHADSIHTAGVFAQDEISVSDNVRLTLALRLDHNKYTGNESQPTVRGTWNITPSQTVWAAASHAVRVPSRGESGVQLSYVDGQVPSPLAPAGSGVMVPLVLRVSTSPDFGSEKLQAFELGWRAQWTPTLTTDLVLFNHRYENLRKTVVSNPLPSPVFSQTPGSPTPTLDYLVVTGVLDSVGTARLSGAELSLEWRATPDLRFQLSHTFNQTSENPYDTGQLAVPRNMTSVRASWTPRNDINVDAWWRNLSERPAGTLSPRNYRDAFYTLDARIGWKPRADTEVALIANNLLDTACDAYKTTGAMAVEVTRTVPTCRPRAFAGQVRVDF